VVVVILECDFSMGYKLGHFHFVVDAFSRFLDTIKNSRIHDRTTNASLFLFQLEWLHEVHTYISTKKILEGYSMEHKKKLVLKALPFTIIKGKSYKQGQNQFLHPCLHDDNILVILWEMHEGVGGRHFSIDIIT
jgi:hypothetical protein